MQSTSSDEASYRNGDAEAKLLRAMRPFGTALAVAIFDPSVIVIFVGSLLGIVIFEKLSAAAALAFLALICFLLGAFRTKHRNPFTFPLVVGALFAMGIMFTITAVIMYSSRGLMSNEQSGKILSADDIAIQSSCVKSQLASVFAKGKVLLTNGNLFSAQKFCSDTSHTANSDLLRKQGEALTIKKLREK